MSSITTTYREGIVSAIITLGNGSKGAPLIAIKKHVQGSSCNWNNHAEEGSNNKFYNSNFLCALKKAEADGVITKHGRGMPSYKLSAGTKKKVTKNAEEFYKQCALEEEKEEEASEESSESEDEIASPEPEGVKDSDDSRECKTTYREGIVAAILALSNGSKGAVSYSDIKQYLKGYSSTWNKNYYGGDNDFKIPEFLDSLSKATDDGVITKHGRGLPSYKLSAETKLKVSKNAEEFYNQCALEEEKEEEASEESSESEDEIASPEPEGVKDSDDSRECKTTYREGIVAAILALSNGSKGAVSYSDIKQYLKGYSSTWNKNYYGGDNDFKIPEFLDSLSKATDDGVITKHGRGLPSYKLSAETKLKVSKNAEEFYNQCALEEEKEEEASEESSESEDEIASPEPEGEKDSDDSNGCKTTYREGIVAAIRALGNGSKGEVSLFGIEKYLKGYSSTWKNRFVALGDHNEFQFSSFLTALSEATDDGVITKHERGLPSYELSAETKLKVSKNAEKFYRLSALEEEKEDQIRKSVKKRDFISSLLIDALDECHRGMWCAVEEDELSGSLLSKYMKALRPEHSMILVPMVDSKWFSNGSDGLLGMDKSFQKYIDVASEGRWTVLAVEMNRVDSIEGNPNLDNSCPEHQGDIEIRSIYDYDGNSMNTNILDNLKINWKKSEGITKNKQTKVWERGDGGLLSTYPWRDDSVIWENGKVVEKAYEDGEGVSNMFERVHNECFLVGLLKELVESK